MVLDDHMTNMSKGQLLGLFITLGVITFIISKSVLAYFLYWKWSRNRVSQETKTEYVETGRATEKGDVYSYGVVLLELITGKRPTDEAFVEKGNNIVTWVRALVEDGCEEHAFDPDLVDVSTRQEMKEAFIVAYNCLNQNPSDRPTMAQVVKMIEEIRPDASSNKNM